MPEDHSRPAGPSAAPDFKTLYRKLESTLGRIERIENTSEMLSNVLDVLVTEFRDELGFEGGRLYERDGEEFVLCCATGRSSTARLGYRMPPDYPPHRRTLEEGFLIMGPDDPAFDAEVERSVGVDCTFAAIAVGEGKTHVFAFSVRGEIKEESILYSLSAVRHLINLKLQQRQFVGALQEARRIQESLLPASPPVFEGFDIDGLSRPAETVGGDLFDYLPLSDRLLGLAIADASGHGLPAALLARDVITGLRMGVDEDLKVVKVIERLNRVINRAALSSAFISLFYGELDSGGGMIYCNAGQSPPLLLHDGTFHELREGGLILGPNPRARYEKGHARIERGDTLILYTDGVTEIEKTRGVPFGVEALQRVVRRSRGGSAREIVEAVFHAVDAYAANVPPQDDMTVVAVRRV